jgi:hypothetical protein
MCVTKNSTTNGRRKFSGIELHIEFEVETEFAKPLRRRAIPAVPTNTSISAEDKL